ncbi:isochorismatase family protein [Streptomyces griseus]|uniref:isochorismatase family protein n=1 Tax=Streptomyces griseus TaxID=1911 RepID=UPI00379DE61B
MLVPSVGTALPHIARLIARARSENILAVYADEKFGEWRSRRKEIMEKTLAGKNAELVEPVLPHGDSLFVARARHSIFYRTPMSYLLPQSGAEHVVLRGQVTEQAG